MYQALYRKYRPQTFDDVVGQQSVTQTLKSQLVSGKLSHAYLFTGSRGTGKTTCSKILAKAVNCLQPVNGNPCNCCAACRSIDEGSCMDVLEIDAASNNGVDNVRTLREDAIYAPAQVKMRVYIIDEVHMLSMSAFNALLKIIEEPPAHLLFILATTELHKVPATILSRCQRFSFRRITAEDVTARLNYVAYEEGIALEPEAAALLGRLADGALRDGLSLLDQCAASTTGPVSAETVYACLGLTGARKAAELLDCAARHDSGGALRLLSEQYAQGKDIAALLDELVSLCRDLLILRTAPENGRSMLSGVCTDAEYRKLLPQFSPGELLRCTRLLQDTAAGFQRSANRRVDAELCLLQLCDPGLTLDAQALNARLSKLEQLVAQGVPVRAVPAPPAEEELPPPPGDEDAPPEEAPAPPPSEELPVGFWADFVAKVKPQLLPSAACHFSTMERAAMETRLTGDVLELTVKTSFVKDAVDNEMTRAVLVRAASELLHRPMRVLITVQGKRRTGGDPMNALLQKGKEHPTLFHIQ